MDSMLEENTIDRPDISIIIPTYNEEDFIGEALKRIYELLPRTLKAEVIKGIRKLSMILSAGKCGMEVVTLKVRNVFFLPKLRLPAVYYYCCCCLILSP